jgi:hypothetical protein
MASDLSVTEFILFPPGVIKDDKDDRYGSEAIESGSYFNLFALEMEKRQAALVVTFLLLRCLELGERLLQNCAFRPRWTCIPGSIKR